MYIRDAKRQQPTSKSTHEDIDHRLKNRALVVQARRIRKTPEVNQAVAKTASAITATVAAAATTTNSTRLTIVRQYK